MARRSAGCARDSSVSVARGVCWRRRVSRSTAASSKRSIIEIAILHEGRSIAGARSSRRVWRGISQLDTADRHEPSDVLVLKTSRLKEKLDKLKEEMGKLAAHEKQMLASLDSQISLTDPDSRSM